MEEDPESGQDVHFAEALVIVLGIVLTYYLLHKWGYLIATL